MLARHLGHPARVVVFLVTLSASLFLGAELYSQSAVVDTARVTAQISPLPAEFTPAAPSDVIAGDARNDDGHAVDITWTLSASEQSGAVDRYEILRASDGSDDPALFTSIGEVAKGTATFTDGSVSEGGRYYYKVVAINDSLVNGTPVFVLGAESAVAGPAIPVAQWFDLQRVNVFVGVLLLSGFIIYYIMRARAGKEIFIRKIAGLEAVDEAVGRATEMGRKIYYIPGSQDMDQVQTIAGITILGRVAQMAAQYETQLEVPVSRSLVMVTAREVVKEAYARSGRPDSFKDDQVHYITDDQFGYAAALDGKIVREKPATIFLMGLFYAESLVLAETGNSVGAIQIAGTGEPSQLPFFVAACDYTLIGEELFAASAYLSKEPRQLGSLKGQDIGKGVILVAIVVGILLETFYLFDFSKLFKVIE